jgi:hypothetical protein
LLLSGVEMTLKKRLEQKTRQLKNTQHKLRAARTDASPKDGVPAVASQQTPAAGAGAPTVSYNAPTQSDLPLYTNWTNLYTPGVSPQAQVTEIYSAGTTNEAYVPPEGSTNFGGGQSRNERDKWKKRARRWRDKYKGKSKKTTDKEEEPESGILSNPLILVAGAGAVYLLMR